MFSNYRIIHLRSLDPRLKSFVLREHYLHSLPRAGSEYFGLVIDNKLRGVAIFGNPTAKQYNGTGLELKRFCLSKNAPMNTCSWFMSKCIRILSNKGIRKIITYADPSVGHEGTMYRACNYKYVGMQPFGSMVVKVKGITKPFHSRIAYQKIKGKYTKTALKLQELMKQGKAKCKAMPKKHIFEYIIK